jgi:post-segregation antitoxin (ccd killing protein)
LLLRSEKSFAISQKLRKKKTKAWLKQTKEGEKKEEKNSLLHEQSLRLLVSF